MDNVDQVTARAASFSEKVQELMAAGKSRMDATKKVSRSHPELHRAFLEHTNPRSNVKKTIADSFEGR